MVVGRSNKIGLYIVACQVADLFRGVFVEQSSELVGDAFCTERDGRVGLDHVLVLDAVTDVQKQTRCTRHTTNCFNCTSLNCTEFRTLHQPPKLMWVYGQLSLPFSPFPSSPPLPPSSPFSFPLPSFSTSTFRHG